MSKSLVKPAIAIVGLGNVLLMDDGIGIHAVRQLQADGIKDVTIAEIGTNVLRSQEIFEKADVVIAIDSVMAGGSAGMIYRFDAANAGLNKRISLHDLGAIGMLKIMPEHLRPQVVILGAEPEIIDYGMELSGTLQTALDKLVQVVRDTVSEIKESACLADVHIINESSQWKLLKN
jgi:hydrogenase maturation protease